MIEVVFTVPLVPPSVNHYKRSKKGGGFFRSPEATAFIDAVCIFAGRAPDEFYKSDFYEVDMTVFLEPASYARMKSNDVDNFLKIGIDALAHARVVHNDGAIVDLHVHKRQAKDSRSTRTEYHVLGKKTAELHSKSPLIS